MVYGLIRSVQASLKYRGGWKGLFEHMYTVSPPFMLAGGGGGRFIIIFEGVSTTRIILFWMRLDDYIFYE